MPGGDGTGPLGNGPVGGRRQGGLGRGRGAGYGAGPSGYCVCPKCGEQTSHTAGTPCSQVQCPKCGTLMVRGG